MKSAFRSVIRALILVFVWWVAAAPWWQTQPLARWQCSYTVAPLSQRFDAAGGGSSLTVTTQSNCPWSVTNPHDWITVTNGTGRTGSGTVAFTVTANLTRDLRQGTLTVAGRSVLIEQTGQGGNCVTTPIVSGQTINGALAAGDCTDFGNMLTDRYVFSGKAGELVAITLSSPNLLANLILFNSSGSIIGQASIFTPPGAPNGQRSARIPSQAGFLALPSAGDYQIVVSGQAPGQTGEYTLNLITVPAGCDSYTLLPARQSFAASGGTGSLQIAAGGNCPWTIEDNLPWVTITSGAAGAGSLPVRYTVAANTGAYRTGTLTVAGYTFRIEQAGATGVCAATPITSGQIVNGAFSAEDCRSPFTPAQNNFGSEPVYSPSKRYSFAATAGQKLDAAVAVRAAFNPGLLLYTIAGRLLFESTTQPVINNFTIPVNGDYVLEIIERNQATQGEFGLTFNLTPVGCGYVLLSNGQTFEAAGGAGSFAVASGAGCVWRAVSDSPWLTVTQGATGTGAGTVNYSVAANTSALLRRGTITVAGRSYVVEQAGAGGTCTPLTITGGQTVSSALQAGDCRSRLRNANFASPPPAKRFRFTGTAGQPVQFLLNSNNALWLYLTSATGAVLDFSQISLPEQAHVNGDFFILPTDGTYFVEVTADFAANDQPFALTFNTRPAGCTYRLTASESTFDGAGGAGMVAVATTAGCAWTAVSHSSWLRVTEGASGSGAGTAKFTVAANQTTVYRRATLTIAGQMLFIDQAGNGGMCAVQALTANQPVNGSLSNADCRSRYAAQVGTSQGPADTFGFNAQAGEQIVLTALAMSQNFTSPVLTLSDAQGRPLLRSNSSGNPALLPASGVYLIPATGTYLVELTGFTGDYTLSLFQAPASCVFNLSASEQLFDAPGGGGSFDVTAATGCNWRAVSNASWVTLANTTSVNGNGRVTFTVAANPANSLRQAAITVAGQVFTIQQAGATGSCLPRDLSSGQTVSGTLDFNADCRSRTNSSSPLDRYRITFTDGQQFALAMRTTNNFAPYLVITDENGVTVAESTGTENNNGRLPQNGFITLPSTGVYFLDATTRFGGAGNYTLAYETPTSCAISLLPNFQQFEGAGGMSSLRVVSGAGCAWTTAPSNAPWLTVTGGASGAGNGTVTYTAAANNSGAARRGTLTVSGQGGGQSFSVEQASAGGQCAPRALALNQRVEASLTAADCAALYVQNQNPSFSYIADRYRFTAAAGDRVALQFSNANTSGLIINLIDPRSGRVTFGAAPPGTPIGFSLLPLSGSYELEFALPGGSPGVDYSFRLSHLAAGCRLALGAKLQTFEFGGGTGEFAVATTSGCAYVANTNNDWITLTNASGTGSGTVRFTVAANNTAEARNGVIQIGDQIFIVAQGGVGGNCAITPLVAGQLAGGTLAASDCLIASNPQAPPGFGTLQRGDRFSFTGGAGQQVQLHLLTNFSPFSGIALRMNLVAPDGNSLAATNSSSANVLPLPTNGWTTLPVDGVYFVEVADASFAGSDARPYQLLLTQTAGQCAFGLSQSGASFDGAGGTSSVRVLTNAGCNWTATPSASWVTINGTASGTGTATVNFTVAANASSNYRTATLLIGGQLFKIEQAGASGFCNVQALPLGQPVNYTMNAADCRITVNNEARLVRRFQFTVTGNQQLRLTNLALDQGNFPTVNLYDANGNLLAQTAPNFFSGQTPDAEVRVPESGLLGLPAAGTYFVEILNSNTNGGRFVLTANVAPAGCSYSVLPDRRQFNASNTTQTGSFSVLAGTGCTWTAGSNAAWVTLTGANANGQVTGSGAGTVNFSVAAYAETFVRQGALAIAGQNVIVEQGGTFSQCTPIAITPGQTYSGESTSAQFNTACVLGLRPGNAVEYGTRYTFNGRAGERVSLSITPTGNVFGNLPTFRLRDPNLVLLGTSELLLPAEQGNQPARLPSRGYLLLPANGLYTLEAVTSSNPRSYQLTLNLQPACNFAVASQQFSFEANGGMGTIGLQTGTGCDWALMSNVPWITTAAFGNSSGAPSFTVASNTGNTSRTGTLSLGSVTITVTQLARAALVSAASYSPNELAPEAIAAAFGQGLSSVTEIARTVPLPTRLGNVVVRVRDSANVTRDAPLFAVTPGQVNFLIPAGTALGRATMSFVNNNIVVATGDININVIAPGIFTANASGQGVPAGVVLRIRNGQQIYENLVRFDAASSRYVAEPIDLGPSGDEVFVVMFGTGWRGRAASSLAAATLGGENAPVLYAGSQNGLAGLDQMNIRVPRSLIGRGLANLAVILDGRPLNVVQVTIK